MQNFRAKFLIFWATHKWTTVMIGIELFILLYMGTLIVPASWRAGGPSQFINAFFFMTPITLFFYCIDSMRANDPETSEHKRWLFFAVVIAVLYFGALMYFGLQAKQFNNMPVL